MDYQNYQCKIEDVRANGRRKTRSLFKEMQQTSQLKRFPACYTLREAPVRCAYWDIELPSAKQIYVLSDSEYEAAMKLVGSIEHWNILIANDWFVNGTSDFSWTGLAQWREEQTARKESIAEKALLAMVAKGNVTAAKALLASKDKKRGRPSKEEVEGTKKQIARADKNTYDDAARIGLTLVKK